MAAFYTDCGDRIPAELYFGMSTRLCTTLGLGEDANQWVKDGVITHDEMTWRNWTYWMSHGLFTGGGISVDLLGGIPLAVRDPDQDQILWDYAPTKIPPQMNLITLIFKETSALCVIACQIADVVNNLRPSSRLNVVQVAEQVTKIDLELNNWKSRLPPQLDITLMNRNSSTPQRLMLHLAYWFCFIILHRPFFNRRTQPIQNSDPEVDHVKNVMELLDTWSSLYTMRLASLKMAGVIFSAGTVFFLRALQATGSSRIAHGMLNAVLAQVETCIRHLHEMGNTWPSATRSAEMLQAMLNDRLKPVIMRRLARQGMKQTLVAEETQDVSGTGVSRETNIFSTESSFTPYTPEWDSQSDHATAWSELLLDSNFFAQIQNTPDVGSSDTLRRSETAFPEVEMNGVFLPIFDSLRAPEDCFDESQRNLFAQYLD
ncbi:hypothetical protein B0H12DRAFT_1244230 [Mycena haematopus]|nr:hypothetical protein B0H12DRAFT_1244230 [Mycena haematopus]